MVVSTVGLEGPTPISTPVDSVFGVMTLGSEGFRRGEAGFSIMGGGDRGMANEGFWRAGEENPNCRKLCHFSGGWWIPFVWSGARWDGGP